MAEAAKPFNAAFLAEIEEIIREEHMADTESLKRLKAAVQRLKSNTAPQMCYRCKVKPRYRSPRGLESYCEEHRFTALGDSKKRDRDLTKRMHVLKEFYRP